MRDKLTPKENYMRMCRGEEIEYIPTHNMWTPPINNEAPIKPFGIMNMLYDADQAAGKSIFHDHWGVEYCSVPAANGGYIPTGTHTGHYLIEDLDHWRDYLKKPTFYDEIDWKLQAEKELSGFDRDWTAVVCGSPIMPFQAMMAFLGFEEGLYSFVAEPELIKEILDFCISYLEPHLEANAEFFKPDLFYLLDDTATERAPFLSVEMFKDIIVPFYKRILKPYTDRGIPVIYHNCGRCEPYLPTMVELGARYWDPAQPVNDLHHIQKTLGKEYNFSIIGGFDWKPASFEGVTEEEVRQRVRDNIDEFAPEGHFLAAPGVIGKLGDPMLKKISDWMADESYRYRREWVKKQG